MNEIPRRLLLSGLGAVLSAPIASSLMPISARKLLMSTAGVIPNIPTVGNYADLVMVTRRAFPPRTEDWITDTPLLRLMRELDMEKTGKS